MEMRLWVLSLALVMALGLVCRAQPAHQAVPTAPSKASDKLPPGVTADTIYPLPSDNSLHSQIRDIQFRIDQLALRDQQWLVQIEKDKADIADMTNQVRKIVADYADQMKIDLDSNEFQWDEIKLRPRQKVKTATGGK
jgi:hypothetical protein